MKRAIAAFLLFLAFPGSVHPQVVGAWLWEHGYRRTIWVVDFVPGGGRTVGHGDFHPENTIIGTNNPARYGQQGSRVNGSISGERCAGQSTAGEATLPGCLLLAMGAPPGYRMTLQDSTDLLYVESAGKSVCDELEATLGCRVATGPVCGDHVCAATETSATCLADCPRPVDCPVCPVCKVCPEPVPCMACTARDCEAFTMAAEGRARDAEAQAAACNAQRAVLLGKVTQLEGELAAAKLVRVPAEVLETLGILTSATIIGPTLRPQVTRATAWLELTPELQPLPAEMRDALKVFRDVTLLGPGRRAMAGRVRVWLLSVASSGGSQ